MIGMCQTWILQIPSNQILTPKNSDIFPLKLDGYELTL